MYGGANGVTSTQRHGTTSVSATYNETSTNMKTALETWYQNNIAGKLFESDVVDNLFCNDRQLRDEVGGASTGPGYGNTGTTTYYAAYQRLNTTKTPTLKCGLKNDRFTTNDVSIGNGSLTYPVGLLTADEVAMAGLRYSTTNTINYLYTGQNFWLFSPNFAYSDGRAVMLIVGSDGKLFYEDVNIIYGVRLVVSIASLSNVTGTGTNTDPYKAI